MHREMDDLDSATAPDGKERRSHSAQLVYMRKLSRLQNITSLSLAASVFTLLCIVWQLYQDRDFERYLECVNFAAIGVKEPTCKPFEFMIESQTNAYERWQQRLKDRTTEQQQRESKGGK